jgi:hypothetical protein
MTEWIALRISSSEPWRAYHGCGSNFTVRRILLFILNSIISIFSGHFIISIHYFNIYYFIDIFEGTRWL